MEHAQNSSMTDSLIKKLYEKLKNNSLTDNEKDEIYESIQFLLKIKNKQTAEDIN